jgi:predicted transcriptional regulator
MYRYVMNNTNTINNDDLGLKFNALSSEFRRLLLGLIYTDGPVYQSDILKHVGVESNKLAYHLNILRTANLISREYGRNGKNVSRYSIKEDGTKFLENIGAQNKLKMLNTPVLNSHQRHKNHNRFQFGKNQQHQKKAVSQRKIITA